MRSGECAICHKGVDYANDDWTEIEVQVKNVTVKLLLCEDHAARMRMAAAREIRFTL